MPAYSGAALAVVVGRGREVGMGAGPEILGSDLPLLPRPGSWTKNPWVEEDFRQDSGLGLENPTVNPFVQLNTKHSSFELRKGLKEIPHTGDTNSTWPLLENVQN